MNKELKLKILESGQYQRDIIKELGISEQHFSMIARGKILPRRDLRQKIADYFHCQVSDIFIL